MAELMDVLDFILNRCSIRELEAIKAAVERKSQQLDNSNSFNPEKFAKRMSNSVTQSINHSISGIQNSFREYARNLVYKDSPDLSEEQVDALIEQLIPDIISNKHIQKKSAPLNLKGIPPDAMQEMIIQFVAYSTGNMSSKENTLLRSSVGDWTKIYWNAFPDEIKSLIKSYLENTLDYNTFLASIAMLLF